VHYAGKPHAPIYELAIGAQMMDGPADPRADQFARHVARCHDSVVGLGWDAEAAQHRLDIGLGPGRIRHEHDRAALPPVGDACLARGRECFATVVQDSPDIGDPGVVRAADFSHGGDERDGGGCDRHELPWYRSEVTPRRDQSIEIRFERPRLTSLRRVLPSMRRSFDARVGRVLMRFFGS